MTIINRETMEAAVREHLGALGVSDGVINQVIDRVDADAADTAQSFEDWTEDEYEMCCMRTLEEILNTGLEEFNREDWGTVGEPS